MPQRTGLGKGLDALIPGGSDTRPATAGGVTQAAVESIARNPRQPRLQFSGRAIQPDERRLGQSCEQLFRRIG